MAQFLRCLKAGAWSPAGWLALGGLAGLELFLVLAGVPTFLFPRPSAVWAALWDPSARIAEHGLVTAFEASAGLACGTAAALVLAVAFVLLPRLEAALYPWVLVSQMVPLVVLAPLLIFWFGTGYTPRIILAALFAAFPILINLLRGLREIDRERLILLQLYGANRWQVLRYLRWPHSLPLFFSGLKVGTALAVIGALSGELIGANRGLGFAVSVASQRLETARTFAAVVAAALIGLIFHAIVVLLERLALRARSPSG